MFCSKRVNNRINKSHELALRLVYDDCETSFSDLPAKYRLFLVHHTNIQTLLLVMYIIKQNLSESRLEDLFNAVNGNYNLRSQSDYRVSGIKTFFTVPIQLDFLDQ